MPAPVGRSTSACPSVTADSILSSISSGSFCPPAAKSLIPLSGIGLCEADSITPRSAPVWPTRYAIAGVGSTPTRTTLAPTLVRPATTAASSISPLARGSRPTMASGWWLLSLSISTRPAATATASASSGVRSPFASPRTPSVPKSRPMSACPFAGACPSQNLSPRGRSGGVVERTRQRRETAGPAPGVGRTRPSVRRGARSALRVLRSLAGLLETVLLALLDAGVTGEEAGLLQSRAVVRLVGDQGAGDAEAQCAGLAGDAAAAQVRDHVEDLGLLGGDQRLADELLVHLAREVGLEVAAVAGDLAGAGDEAHPDDGLLAAADGLDRTVTGTRGADRGRRGRLNHDDRLSGRLNHDDRLSGLLDGLDDLGLDDVGHAAAFSRAHCATWVISNGFGC